MKKKTVEMIIIIGQQDFGNFQVLNPIEIKIEDDRVINLLKQHNNSVFNFVVVGLLFSRDIKTETNQIFIISNGLRNARDALINAKPHKILWVVNVNEIHYHEKIKGLSNCINVTFQD